MVDRPFIKSVYYTAERKKQNSESCPHEPAQTNSVQARRPLPPPVPEHYFAPKPISTKPLIESSYCVSAASVNYLMKSPNVAPFHYDAEIESEPTSPATVSSEMHYNQAPLVSQQYGEQYRPCQGYMPSAKNVEGASIPVTKTHYGNQHVEVTKDDVIKKDVTAAQMAEVSEYAWKRLDEEKKQQYAVNLWHEENEEVIEVSCSNKMTAETTKKQIHVQSVDLDNQKFISPPAIIPAGIDCRPSADSVYVAIPNDLYPAYRKTMAEKETTSTTTAAQSPDVAADDGKFKLEFYRPIDGNRLKFGSGHSEVDRENAEENAAYRSRFATQIKTKQSERQPSPVKQSHSKAQYSPIGYAFTPVGQPQISEYQLNDLNDLESCIDAH